MNKIINLIKKIKQTNINVSLSIIAITISSIIFLIPFMNVFTTKNILQSSLICILLGIFISSIIIGAQYAYLKIQSNLININFKNLLITNNFIFSIELILFAIFSYALLLAPLFYLIFGIIVLMLITMFNIFYNYHYFKDTTTSKLNLIKSLKKFHLTIIIVVMIFWILI